MWILKKPCLVSAINDIDVLIDHCRALEGSHKPKLKQLYLDYENGKGEVSFAQLQPLTDKADVIREQYKKTYNTRGSNQLYYVRRELIANVQKCPYCSINKPSQLDHFVDKSKYGQLATCRLNLVPLCSICNWLKSSKDYSGFTHPYYQTFPKQPFLIAVCRIVKQRVVFDFRIDSAVIIDECLFNRLNNQVNATKLQSRLREATQEFIYNEFANCFASNKKELETYLDCEERKMCRIYHLNDWRTAVIRGLKACDQFDINVVRNMNNAIKPINGCGA